MNTNKKTVGFWDRYFVTEAGFNLSWSSVIAGVVTFLALMLMFTFISAAVGLGMFSPDKSNPMAGVTTGILVWNVIALVLSLFGGGFVAGLAARRTGLLHGFLTWALSMILVVMLVSSALSSMFGLVGNVVGSIAGSAGNVAGNVAGKAADTAGDLIGEGINAAGNQIEKIDTSKLGADIEKILKDTGVKELQPEYLEKMLENTKNEALKAGKEIVVNPSKAEEVFKNLADNMKKRIQTLDKAADRDALEKAIAKNTDLSKEEAAKTLDNVEKGLKEARTEAKAQIEKAEKALAKAKKDLEKTIKDVRETADDVTDSAAKASVWIFVAMLLGLVLTSFAGYLGSQKLKHTIIQK